MKPKAARANALIATVLMLLAVAAAYAMTPRQLMATQRAALDLGTMIPEAFDGWRTDTQAPALVNPEQDEALQRIYTQIVSRTYINRAGSRIMLSVTYGPDQRADRAVHYPEVCYPAQGFQVQSNRVSSIPLPGLELPVRLLETNYNNARREPVTYWTTIGDHSSVGGSRKRLIELQYGLKGMVPDGILFRVSSIGSESAAEFAQQAAFIQDLMKAVRPDNRLVLTGKTAH
jgi:EpsI family protein